MTRDEWIVDRITQPLGRYLPCIDVHDPIPTPENKHI